MTEAFSQECPEFRSDGPVCVRHPGVYGVVSLAACERALSFPRTSTAETE